ncbi:NFACT family protein [uncultured Veillonella sp.]|uniref:Rqc2 family fibronectin-binding protein n=1 Tax=uncultured Veillonella sp. TaxID=159268 RepID=UPI0025E86D77|nr:NFACT family protein [uncultured Veillonella sp.]
MNLDGLTLSVLTRELSSSLVNGQIQRLVQIDKTSLVFRINTLEGNKNLMITVGNTPACYISKDITDLPKEPSALCMFLRKHIETARITSIEQLHGDRILLITVDKLSLDGSLLTTKIYVELMGKYSNCIFVQNGIILESLIHVTPLMNRERAIGPKLPYELPPNSNRMSLFEVKESEINALLTNFAQDTVGATLRHIFNGLGPVLLKELCYIGTINEKDSFADLSETQIDQLGQAILHVRDKINDSTELLVYALPTGKQIVSPIALTYIPGESQLISTYPSLSIPLEQDVMKQGGIHTATKDLERLITQAIKKEVLRHTKIQDELEVSKEADTFKMLGDLLMINSYMDVHYESNITLQNVLVDPPEDITIKLVPELTLVENAQQYYKQYTKLKNRVISGNYQLEESTKKLDYYNSILYSLSLAKTKEDVQEIYSEFEAIGLIKKSKKPLSYKLSKENFLRFNLQGGTVFIGRNNKQNEYLTHRFAKPTDIWFHTLQIQGSHVILRPDGEPSDDLLTKVAQFAAYYSKANNSTKVPVDYTYIKFIKKPPASPLGFVIYTHQQTVIVDPKSPESSDLLIK